MKTSLFILLFLVIVYFRKKNYLIMEHMLNDTVPVEDLKKFEQKYHEELQQTGKVLIYFIASLGTQLCLDFPYISRPTQTLNLKTKLRIFLWFSRVP